MSSRLGNLLIVAGFLLILFFCPKISAGSGAPSGLLRQRPRLKYVAYPLGALLGLGAAALIIHALVDFRRLADFLMIEPNGQFIPGGV